MLKDRMQLVMALCALSSCVPTTDASAALFTIYDDRSTFEATLGAFVVDDYEDPGYEMGDKADEVSIDIFSNAAMSAVVGETDYFTTGFDNHNIIQHGSGDNTYCAGCNGSYELGFATTSVGDADGVFGVGWDIWFNRETLPYHAFITFGDGTTHDAALPIAAAIDRFFGVTSSQKIRSIHLGLADGGVTRDGSFVIDDLTIGAAAATIPEPVTVTTGLLGLSTLATLIRRRRA